MVSSIDFNKKIYYNKSMKSTTKSIVYEGSPE